MHNSLMNRIETSKKVHEVTGCYSSASMSFSVPCKIVSYTRTELKYEL
jgi:hypothetical protein